MRRQGVISDNAVNIADLGITVQLAGSYLIAGVIGLGLLRWLGRVDVVPPLVIILVLVCSIGTGLLVTVNIQYGMFLLHLSLSQLVEGKSIELPRLHWLWPCSTLFRSLDIIKRNMEDLLQRERLTDEYRKQLLQQASEAEALEERNRLARELHDSIKQQLFSIRMSAIAARAQMQDGRNV